MHRCLLSACGVMGIYISSCSCFADDYKIWLQLMPNTLDGLTAHPNPMGMNSDVNDRTTAMLIYEYGNDKQSISVTINSDTDTEASREPLSQTPEGEMPTETFKKTVVEGNFTALDDDKVEHLSTATIIIKDKGIVTIAAKPDVGIDRLTAIARQLPIKAIANTMQGK